jgi:hypothetical protein
MIFEMIIETSTTDCNKKIGEEGEECSKRKKRMQQKKEKKGEVYSKNIRYKVRAMYSTPGGIGTCEVGKYCEWCKTGVRTAVLERYTTSQPAPNAPPVSVTLPVAIERY